MACIIETIKCGFVNAFIVSDGSSAILVDTGMEEHRYEVLKIARDRGVRLLVLTHGHIDHVQNAKYLSDELGVPIAMSEKDVPLIKDPLSQKMEARDLIGKRILPDGKAKIPEFTPSVLLKDGDTLSPFGINAKVIALPGHTDGSIGIDIEETSLIVGDALMNMLHPSLPHIYHNKEEMLESAKKITALGERTVYFGHGKCSSNRIWVKN